MGYGLCICLVTLFLLTNTPMSAPHPSEIVPHGHSHACSIERRLHCCSIELGWHRHPCKLRLLLLLLHWLLCLLLHLLLHLLFHGLLPLHSGLHHGHSHAHVRLMLEWHTHAHVDLRLHAHAHVCLLIPSGQCRCGSTPHCPVLGETDESHLGGEDCTFRV